LNINIRRDSNNFYCISTKILLAKQMIFKKSNIFPNILQFLKYKAAKHFPLILTFEITSTKNENRLN